MNLNVLPADCRPVTLTRKPRTKNKFTIEFPDDIIKRYHLKIGDEILIAYVCDPKQDPTVNNH